jgi:hypothetical protein
MEWPELPYDEWNPTRETLHRWMQIAGKIRLALTPRENHFWNVALHLTARGLTTRPMPYGGRMFQIDFDFLDHELVVETSDGATRVLTLAPRTVAELFGDLRKVLASLGIVVAIRERPSEILDQPIPFHLDRVHHAYQPEWVERWFEIVRRTSVVLEEFRARFIGKASPVHFYWGSFDLSTSRYSGRRAAVRPDADVITREAYSHETASAGFWCGDERYREPAFYAYTAPVPDGLAEARVRPTGAFWHGGFNEHLLPYEAVRRARDPRAALLDFWQSAYDAGATLARWDRAALERDFEREPAPLAPQESPAPL